MGKENFLSRVKDDRSSVKQRTQRSTCSTLQVQHRVSASEQ